MASSRQIAANRKNARQSTGPRTIAGKMRSRANAMKHGMTATVLHGIEDAQEYRRLQLRIRRQYRPVCPTDEELLDRLCSLLWRLRRAGSIESGLLSIHVPAQLPPELTLVPNGNQLIVIGKHGNQAERAKADIAEMFVRLSNRSGAAFDRLQRYEKTLWRQVAQIIFMLKQGDP